MYSKLYLDNTLFTSLFLGLLIIYWPIQYSVIIINTARADSKNNPRRGSLTKLCTDTNKPDRIKNVPNKLSINPSMDIPIVHDTALLTGR